MAAVEGLPPRGPVFWPVGAGDSTTVVVDESPVLQVDLHDMAKADDEVNPEMAVIDELIEALPVVDGPAADMHARYDDVNRRLCNQAFFTAIYIDEDNDLRAGYARPFDALTDREVQADALTWVENARNESEVRTRLRGGSSVKSSHLAHLGWLQEMEHLAEHTHNAGTGPREAFSSEVVRSLSESLSRFLCERV